MFTRRDFIGTIAAIGATSAVAGGARKPKETESKMPVWTGDLKSAENWTREKPDPENY